MLRAIIIFCFFMGNFFVPCGLSAQLFKSSGGEVRFHSTAPLEDIEAFSKSGISVLNPETGEISFRVDIKDFQFRKSKMQEHFNENFMESDRYPHAIFRGNIRDWIDFSQDGEHAVTLVGVLDIHGKKKRREIPAKITVKNGQLVLKSQFDVACKDHDIKIPRILWQNIAEVVRVSLVANYTKIE